MIPLPPPIIHLSELLSHPSKLLIIINKLTLLDSCVIIFLLIVLILLLIWLPNIIKDVNKFLTLDKFKQETINLSLPCLFLVLGYILFDISLIYSILLNYI